MASIQTRTNPSGRKRFVARVHHRGEQRAKSFALKSEAEDWVRKHAPSRGQRWDKSLDKMPLGSWVNQWRLNAERDTTLAARKHLADNLGDLRYMRLGQVTPQDVRDWIEELEEGREWVDGKPLARSTCLTLLANLSSAFSDAINEGALITNPCARLRAKRGVNKAIAPADLIAMPDIARLAKVACDPVDSMIRVAATTGMRPGELAGLRPRNVNLGRRELYVVEQAVGRGRDFGLGPLKSEAGQRTIPLPDSTVATLKDVLDAGDGDPALPVFRTDQGIMWTASNMGRVMRQLTEDCEIKATWKSFRHFYASRLIDSGASVKTVQVRMGHASPMVTLSVYTHLLPHEDEKTRSAFEGLF